MKDLSKPWPIGQQIDPVWLREELDRRKKNATPKTRESALAFLVEAGIYTKSGKLTKRYRFK